MSESAWSLEVAAQMLGYESFDDVPEDSLDPVMALADNLDLEDEEN